MQSLVYRYYLFLKLAIHELFPKQHQIQSSQQLQHPLNGTTLVGALQAHLHPCQLKSLLTNFLTYAENYH